MAWLATLALLSGLFGSPGQAGSNRPKKEARMRSIHYRAVAPGKLMKRLGPGTLTLDLDESGKMTGLFAPGGIAGPGRRGATSQVLEHHVDPSRLQELWRLLDQAGFDALPSRTTIRMGEGEPIDI